MRLPHRSAFIFVLFLLINILAVCSCASRQGAAAGETASSAQPAAGKPFHQINVEEFLRIVGKSPKIQIVDVRPANQREMVYIRGSMHIPLENLENRIGEIALGKPIIIYCQTGRMSAAAARILSARNPSELMELGGGISRMFEFLSTEPEKAAESPDGKSLYEKLRGLIVTGAAVVGLPLPDAALTDAGGKPVTIGELKGQPALLVFFQASDLKQFDGIASLIAAYGKKIKGLNYIAVAVAKNDAEARALKKHLKAGKWTGKIYFDLQGKSAGNLGIAELPSFSLIDSAGVLRMHGVTRIEGPVDSCHDRTLEEMAVMMASGKLPPYPMSDAELSEIRQMKLVGAAAPPFSLPDARGETHSLSSYIADGGVLLIFGTLRCPFTARELIAANTCGADSGAGGGFKVIAVLPGGGPEEANAAIQFASEFNIAYPVLLDAAGEIFRKYSISSVPVWWIIDGGGIIRQREIGFADATCATVAKALEK